MRGADGEARRGIQGRGVGHGAGDARVQREREAWGIDVRDIRLSEASEVVNGGTES